MLFNYGFAFLASKTPEHCLGLWDVRRKRLTLGELRSAAGGFETVFLTFLGTSVAGQHAGGFEGAAIFFGFEEGAGESEADGFGLSGESAALGEGDDVITVFGLEKGKRLLEVEDQGFVGEVFLDGAAIDGDFAFASAHVNAGDGGFATAGSVVFFVSHYHLLLIC